MDDTYTHLFLAKPASRFLSEDAQQGMPLLINEVAWHLYRHRLEKPGSWTIDVYILCVVIGYQQTGCYRPMHCATCLFHDSISNIAGWNKTVK